jgi:hypothetical protein
MRLWSRSWPPAERTSNGWRDDLLSMFGARAEFSVDWRRANPHMDGHAGTLQPPRLREIRLTTLLSAPLACCRWELERRHMVPASNDALRLIIETAPDLVATLNEYYGEAAPDGGLDKVEREKLLDLLARHFAGQSWPRTGGMDTTRRFMAALQRAMSAAGWKVDGFAVAA